VFRNLFAFFAYSIESIQSHFKLQKAIYNSAKPQGLNIALILPKEKEHEQGCGLAKHQRTALP
jgi:hypothetical protein